MSTSAVTRGRGAPLSVRWPSVPSAGTKRCRVWKVAPSAKTRRSGSQRAGARRDAVLMGAAVVLSCNAAGLVSESAMCVAIKTANRE